MVLTDLHMPGTDGFGMVQQMRNSPSGTWPPVALMVTSAEHKAYLNRAHELGIAACLSKPLRCAELRAALIEFARSAPAPVPDALSPTPPVADSGPALRPAALPLNILLAEDNIINERVACGILRAAGHHVKVARVGSDVQPLLAAHTFDLILMDIQMPQMDGFEVTAAIRVAEKTTGSHLPIIAMTAHVMEGYKERCLAGGMDGYLTKPVRRDLLLAALEFCQSLNARQPTHSMKDPVGVP